jgi:uncharacterized protein (TIGR02594 family)
LDVTIEYLAAKYDADTLTVDYVAGDGTHLLRTGGTAAWRFNNPGNLRPGPSGKPIYGAIGVAQTKGNDKFLIFSSYEEGRKQKKPLLRRKYNDRTIYTMLAGIDDGNGQLIEGYAPKTDNNDPDDYAKSLADHIGKPTTAKLSDLSDAQLESVMDAMETKEGYHGSKSTRKEKIVPTTSVTVSDGAKPRAGVPARIQLGDQQHVTTADAQGRLPPIAHVKEGTPIGICLATPGGEWKKVFDGEMGPTSQTISLVNPQNVFSALAAPKQLLPPPPKTKRSPLRYVVEPHDTLAGIAKRFKTTVGAILAVNPQIKDAAKIYPAQVLSIYDRGAPGPAPAPAIKPAPLSQAKPTAKPSTTPKSLPGVAAPARTKDGQGAPLALLLPDQKQAPWMQVAIAEAKKWGGKAESEITRTSNYHTLTGATFLNTLAGNDNPWCASFVNYCLMNASPSYTKWKNSFRARAVALDSHFVELEKPVFGAVVLVSSHHVSFVYAKSGKSHICLGGNQSDQINFSPFTTGLRFFVPLAYHAYALEELKKKSLPEHTADELNTAFGIAVKTKKGNAIR